MQVKFVQTTRARLSSLPVTNGQLIYLKDEDASFYDLSDARHSLIGVRVVNSLPNTGVANVLYIDLSSTDKTTFIWDTTTSQFVNVSGLYTAGAGLTLNTSNVMKVKLQSETQLASDAVAAAETLNRVYPIALDRSGNLAVTVPWISYTFDATPTASSINPVTSGGIYTALQEKQDALTIDAVPTSGSTHVVESGGVYAALQDKQDTLTFDSTPTDGSNNPVTSDGVYDALQGKQDTLTFDANPTENSDNPVKSGGVFNALAGKQDTLTFDSTPTAASTNPVTSGGVHAALQDKQDVLTFDDTPTQGSTNPVESGGVYTALEDKQDIIQYSSLPSPVVGLDGVVVQYVGATSGDLVNGAFYKCQESDTPGTYEWVLTGATPSAGGHIIENASGTEMTQRPNLQFVGLDVQDDAVLDTTVVTAHVPDEISDLDDVDITSPQDAQILKYDGTSSKWINANAAEGLELGETSTTAYRGDRGKEAYDHASDASKITTAETSGLYKIATTDQGHVASVTAVVKQDILDLGIDEYSNEPAAQGGTDLSLVTTGDKYTWNHKQDELTFDSTPTSASTNPVESGGVYDALADKQDVMQYSSLPSPTSTLDGAVVQYVGTTSGDLVNGAFYRCQESSTAGTYEWVAIEVASGGHVIEDATGTEMTQRAGLQFIGADVTDDSTNDKTIVTIKDTNYKGTKAVWDTLTDAQKAQYETYDFTDDFNGQTVDSALSLTSENPVQNKVITAAIQGIGNSIQVSEMPVASVDNLGRIVEYVGATTATYTNGYFYQCVEDSTGGTTTYKWVAKKVQSGGSGSASALDDLDDVTIDTSTLADNDILVYDSATQQWVNATNSGGQTIQYTTMPTASVDWVGKIVQFVGTSDVTYTKGHFYQGTVDSTSGTAVYSWIESDVESDALDKLTDVVINSNTLANNDIIKYDSATQKWINAVNSGAGQIIQYNEMPTPSIDWVGKIIQYTGTTTADYTRGYFYECIYDGTYKWRFISGGSTIDVDTAISSTSTNPVENRVIYSALLEKQDVMQVTTMPLASAETLGQVVQYVGTSTGLFMKGGFYECIQNVSSYDWKEISSTIQFETMPTANANWAGKVIQYVGTTDATYTKGYFYECINDNGTYRWRISVSGGSIDESMSSTSSNPVENKVIYAALATKQDIMQFSTMPAASADYVGKVVEYTGTTSGSFVKGYFYECYEDSSNYYWREIATCSSEVIQYETLPTASASNVGMLVQYIGTTTQDYTNGYFYRCVNNSGTYSWAPANVQALGSGHIILDYEDTVMPDRTQVKFGEGLDVADNQTDDMTEIDVLPLQEGDMEDIINIVPPTVNGKAAPVEVPSIWMDCAGIIKPRYTTLSDILADPEALSLLTKYYDNATDYLLRCTNWINTIVSNENAMTAIGDSDHCADKLLADTNWRAAILNSQYHSLVIDAQVPVMTSNTTPSGVAASSSAAPGYEAYHAMDNNSSTSARPSSDSETTGWLRYTFTKPVSVKLIDLQAGGLGGGIKDFTISASMDNGITWDEIYSNSYSDDTILRSYDIDNNDFYKDWRLDILTTYDSSPAYWNVAEVQFYGRYKHNLI